MAKVRHWGVSVEQAIFITNNDLTFFVRYGDYLGRVAAFLSIFFVLMTFVRKKVGR